MNDRDTHSSTNITDNEANKLNLVRFRCTMYDASSSAPDIEIVLMNSLRDMRYEMSTTFDLLSDSDALLRSANTKYENTLDSDTAKSDDADTRTDVNRPDINHPPPSKNNTNDNKRVSNFDTRCLPSPTLPAPPPAGEYFLNWYDTLC